MLWGGQPLLNKGFTLIELLAVIVILAIIALIAVPIVINIISETKEKSYDISVDNIMDASKLYYAKEQLKDSLVMDENIYDSVMKIIDGEQPTNGNLYVNKDGEIAFALQYGEWCYTKKYENDTYTKEKTKVCNGPFYYIKVANTTNGGKQPFLRNENGLLKEQIEKIITKNYNKETNEEKSKLIKGYWEVTDQENVKEEDKIYAWYTDEDSNGLYEVYIGQNGGVKANPDSTKLFSYLTQATEIDLTYLDTSNVINMTGMFLNCESIKTINVSSFDTSKVTNMKAMFAANPDLEGTIALQEIIGLENFDTSNVKSMYMMFQNCFNLVSLDLSSFDTREVTDMGNMFYNCVSLTNLDISNFNTRNVTSMKAMFCSAKNEEYYRDPGEMKLKQIVGLENFDTRNVTNMRLMFQNCSNLTTLDLSKWNTGNVTNMDYMFNVCKSLTTLDLSKWNTEKVVDMSYMFAHTSNLKPIYVGSNWTTEGKTTTSMFDNSLTTSEAELVVK